MYLRLSLRTQLSPNANTKMKKGMYQISPTGGKLIVTLKKNFRKILSAVILTFILLSTFIPAYAEVLSDILEPELSGDPTEIVKEDADKRDEYSRHFLTGDE